MTKSKPQHETGDAPRSIPAYVILFIGIFITLHAFGIWNPKRSPMANSETRHEIRDVPPSIPAYAILLIIIFVTGSAFGVWGLLNLEWPAPPARPSPFTNAAQPIGSPPRLQVNPQADLARLNRRMEKRLHSVGWINRNAGIVHMPIDRAMDLLVERGSPDTVLRAPRLHGPPTRLAHNAD